MGLNSVVVAILSRRWHLCQVLLLLLSISLLLGFSRIAALLLSLWWCHRICLGAVSSGSSCSRRRRKEVKRIRRLRRGENLFSAEIVPQPAWRSLFMTLGSSGASAAPTGRPGKRAQAQRTAAAAAL